MVCRILAMEYLGRMDLVQVPPTGVQKNRAEQLAQLAMRQQALELKSSPTATNAPSEQTTTHDDAPQATATVNGNQVSSYLGQISGDAPLCDTCGHVMIRNATCYKCLNCGSTSGCS